MKMSIPMLCRIVVKESMGHTGSPSIQSGLDNDSSFLKIFEQTSCKPTTDSLKNLWRSSSIPESLRLSSHNKKNALMFTQLC